MSDKQNTHKPKHNPADIDAQELVSIGLAFAFSL